MSKQAIYCLHGFMGDQSDFKSLQQGLAQFALVPLELPSNTHEKGAATNNITFQSTLHYLVGIIPEGANLLGYSMGSRIALSLAATYPKHINNLILIGGHAGLTTRDEQVNRNFREQTRAQQLRHAPESFLKDWSSLELFSNIPTEILKKQEQKRLKQLHKNNLQANLWAQQLDIYSLGRQENLWPKLQEIKSSVLLLIGENDQKYSKILQKMQQQLSQSSFVKIKNAGHMPHLEQAQITSKKIRIFLNKKSYN